MRKPDKDDITEDDDFSQTDLSAILGGDASKSFDIIKTLYDGNKNNINFITELSDREIRAVAIILFLADYLNLPEYKTFIKNVLELKVSKGRKGRGEFVDSFKSMVTGLLAQQQKEQNQR